MIVMAPFLIEDQIEITGPLKEEGPKVIIGDHLKEDTPQIEDILGEIVQVKMEDPLSDGGPPDDGGPSDGGGSSDDGGPSDNGRPLGGR